MSLYDRKFASYEAAAAGEQSSSALSSFIKQTYQLFAASLLAASAGAYVGIFYLANMFITSRASIWVLFAIEIGLLFALQMCKRKAPLNLVLLFAFTFVTGLTITPLLISILAMPSGAGIVAQAFALTAVAFGGLSIFAMNTKRNFSTMGKMLFIALIVIVVASIINIFLHSSMMQMLISCGAAILFSFFILYDTQNIIRGNYETPIEAAVALYLDFLNLFIALLQILGIFNSRD